MKIYKDIEQGSIAWFDLRLGVPTASEFSSILTPKFELRKGETFRNYVYAKAAERITGRPLRDGSTWQMENGVMMEQEARAWFEMEHDTEVQLTAFIEADGRRCGCSPDGLIGDDGGLEIKCPAAQTQVKYVYEGKLPDDYAAQVYGSLYVTGREWWKFLSYRRKGPKLLLTIERDEAIMEKIGSALDEFHKQFNAVIEKLSN